jgi:hypothetical protein
MYVEYAAAQHGLFMQIICKELCARQPHLRHNVEHQFMLYGAIARNTCTISDCDTLWKVMGAEVICKYHCNVVQKY